MRRNGTLHIIVTYRQCLQMQYSFVEPSPRVTSFGSSKNALTSRVFSSQRVVEGFAADVTAISIRMSSESTTSAAFDVWGLTQCWSAQYLGKRRIYYVPCFGFGTVTSSTRLISSTSDISVKSGSVIETMPCF